jgi:hypothetical protein
LASLPDLASPCAFLGCVALIDFLLIEGLMSSADLLLRLEVFAGIFIVGSVFLVAWSRSGKKEKGRSER